MTQPTKSNQDLDERLADFTDHLLEARTAADTPSNDELRGLQDTILRLNRAFPPGTLDEQTRQRMQMDFKARVRKDGPSAGPAWRSQQSRQRLILVLSTILLLVIFILAPFLSSGSGNAQGTAGLQTQTLALWIVFGGVIAFILWLGRRK